MACMVKLLLVEEGLDGEASNARLHAEVEPAHLGLDVVLHELVLDEEGRVANGVSRDGAVENLPVVSVVDVLVGEVHGGAGGSTGEAEEPPAGIGLGILLDLASIEVDVGDLLPGKSDAHGGVSGGAEEESLSGGDHVGRRGCVTLVLRLRKGEWRRQGAPIDIRDLKA